MANKTSPHILGTASNLLGFCLIVITSIHVAQKAQNSFADEFVSIIALLLTISCILSFTSIKTNDIKKELLFERIADFLFLVALAGIFIIVLIFVLKLWND